MKEFINIKSDDLKMRKDVSANVHYLKSAPVKRCACAECSEISHLQISSSLLDPFTLCKQLMTLLLKFKYVKAKYILSQHIVTLSLSMCLNDKLLHFKDEKILES